MRFDILTITQDGKKYYDLTVYNLTAQPPEKLFHHQFKSRTDVFNWIKRNYPKH